MSQGTACGLTRASCSALVVSRWRRVTGFHGRTRLQAPLIAPRRPQSVATPAKATSGNSPQHTVHELEANNAKTTARHLATRVRALLSQSEETLDQNSFAALKNLAASLLNELDTAGEEQSTAVSPAPRILASLELFVRAVRAARQQAAAECRKKIADLERQRAAGQERIAQLQRQSAVCQKQLTQVQQEYAAYRKRSEDKQRQDAARQQSSMQQMQQQLSALKKGRDQVLGGELAYTLDRVLCDAVLGPGFFFNLRELANYVKHGKHDAGIHRRWQLVSSFLEARSKMTVDRLSRNMAPLRKQRHPVAHGTQKERQSTTAAYLQSWASSQPPAVQDPADQLLRVLEPLTYSGTPLCPLDQTAINKVFGLKD